ALLQQERWSAAAGRFRRVLRIAPRNAAACLGLSRALRGLGQTREAVQQARRAARLTNHRDAEGLLGLGEAYADADRRADAAKAAREALAATPEGNLELVGRIRRKLTEWTAE